MAVLLIDFAIPFKLCSIFMQVHRLREEFHIYCTDDGRFSMAGINSSNIDYLAASVLAVI